MSTHLPITVIDLGGQYAHLIAAKFRGLGFHAVIADPEAPLSEIARSCGIVLSGSPSLSAYDEDGSAVRRILDLPVPILGFCFGHQEIAKHYGGTVIHGQPEYGPSTLDITWDSPIFRNVPKQSIVFMSHGDTVTSVGPGFSEIGTSATDGGPVHRFAAIADETRRRYGFQYHPEVDDSVFGHVMLENFAGICGCEKTWSADNFLPAKLASIRETAKDRDVFLLVSGGVDSSVVAELLLRALPKERVHMLHVDTGFMREKESDQVRELFAARVGERFHFVDASRRFFEALAGVIAPEQKRKIIGDLFIAVCEEEMSRLNLSDALLAQGTIYPDTIESGGTRRAHVIKTHHNRVPLIEEMIRAGRVLEPIADLYKKEVRELGRALGLPSEWIDRHPFPGPGLAVRLLASDGHEPAERAEVQAGVDAVQWPAGMRATVLPLRSVGVKADLRSYELPLCLAGPGTDPVPNSDVGPNSAADRGLGTDVNPGTDPVPNSDVGPNSAADRGPGTDVNPGTDPVPNSDVGPNSAADRGPGTDVNPGTPPDAGLVATRLKTLAGINRIVWNLGPAFDQVTCVACSCTPDRVSTLQTADAIVTRALRRMGLMEAVWQFPVVQLPLTFSDDPEGCAIVLRPVSSERGMTARVPELPQAFFDAVVPELLKIPIVTTVLLDLSTKPPGTIEWE